jgi:hypothetical protein
MTGESQDLHDIEVLLASRQRLTDWLDKLEQAGSKTPPSVRERVRRDYEGRLSQVVEQLRGHSDVISGSLQALRTEAEQLEGLREGEQETLAEAELRYTVGEYSDSEWHQVEEASSSKIADYDRELSRLAGEINRLEEVLSQITPAADPEPLVEESRETEEVPDPFDMQRPLTLVKEEILPPPAPAAPPAPKVEPVIAKAPPAEPPEAPRFVPRTGKGRESGPMRSINFPPAATTTPPAPAAPGDELAFLKSMALDSPRSGTPATPAPASSTLVDAKTERPSQLAPKTLKCGECGALNRPTEWYCERCGAELAAV